MRNRDAVEATISPSGTFKNGWLSECDKSVAPLPAHLRPTHDTATRALAGARQVAATSVWIVSLDPRQGDDTAARCPLDERSLLAMINSGTAPSTFMIVTENFLGALLFSPGYMLVAGTRDFMRGANPEGLDKARIDFRRYVQNLPDPTPGLTQVVADLPPRYQAWSYADEIPEASHTGRLFSLMREFSSGALDGPVFARRWLAERRGAMDMGERVTDGIGCALDIVFYALEDYAIDPELRDPGDMSDDELRRHVADALIAAPYHGAN